MTTVLEVISTAMYEIDQLAMGDTPEADEADTGLIVLQSIFDDWVNEAAFGAVSDVLATADYTAGEQERVLSGGFTISLPTTIQDKVTGVTRPPLDLTLVQVVTAGQAPQTSIYDALTAQWVRLDGLALDSTCPLANRGRHGLACILAKRLAGNRATVSPQAEAMASRFRMALARKPLAAPRPAPALFY